MNAKLTWIVGLLAALPSAAALLAQEPPQTPPSDARGETPPAAVRRTSLANLPAPLDFIRSNVRDLEATGYFTIAGVAHRTRNDGERVIEWTVRVNRPINCRHVELLLTQFRDVRFYKRFANGSLEEIHSTLLDYSPRIDQGAADGRRLGQDEQFEIWVNLPQLVQRQLTTRDADFAHFGRWDG